MSKIEREIHDATGEPGFGARENEQDYFMRLTVAINALPDREFDGLSEDVQEWATDAVRSANAKAEIAGFKDGEVVREDAETEETEAAVIADPDPKPEAEVAKEKADAKKRAKPKKPKKPFKLHESVGSGGKGKIVELRRVFIEEAMKAGGLPKRDAVVARVETDKIGKFTWGTFNTVLYHMRGAFEALEAHGYSIEAPGVLVP
jgi:hypothetical protein